MASLWQMPRHIMQLSSNKHLTCLASIAHKGLRAGLSTLVATKALCDKKRESQHMRLIKTLLLVVFIPLAGC